jgi:hypothetical protein
MRSVLTCAVLLIVPSISLAQSEEMVKEIEGRLGSLRFVASLQDGETGGFKPAPGGKPSLRATSSAIRTWKYLGGAKLGSEFPSKAKAAAFVMSCYDPKTGGFADAPGGKPDIATTAVGVMAVVEFEAPKETFAKAMEYLQANAKSFEEVRIGAAAVEAWGVKDCPFDLKPWLAIASHYETNRSPSAPGDAARVTASIAAMRLRLGQPLEGRADVLATLRSGQQPDGGWAAAAGKGSDAETTYRVMRAFMLLKEKPTNPAKARAFLARCRNADNGYGAKPDEPSTLSGVYYAAIIGVWLADLEKK